MDADSGYRYHRHTQARHALSTGLPRSLDLPLRVIAEVPSGSADAATLETRADRRPAGRVFTEPARQVVVADITRATSATLARVLGSATGPSQLIGLFPVELPDTFEVRGRKSSNRARRHCPDGSLPCATHVGRLSPLTLLRRPARAKSPTPSYSVQSRYSETTL